MYISFALCLAFFDSFVYLAPFHIKKMMRIKCSDNLNRIQIVLLYIYRQIKAMVVPLLWKVDKWMAQP